MIKYENIVVDNLFTEGFELTLPSAMSIAITEGMFTHVKARETVVFTFPAVEFDVEADDELPVQYDVYLLSEAETGGYKISVSRTEIGSNSVSVYGGDGELIHVLLSFKIAPNTNDLSQVELNVRTIVQAPQEEEDTDETTTEE